jgi:hypothetical protein
VGDLAGARGFGCWRARGYARPYNCRVWGENAVNAMVKTTGVVDRGTAHLRCVMRPIAGVVDWAFS